MYERTEKVFFSPGEVVTLKQDLPNKPKMVVKSVDKEVMRTDGHRPMLFGITCMWFKTDGTLLSERFSTKDLMHVSE